MLPPWRNEKSTNTIQHYVIMGSGNGSGAFFDRYLFSMHRKQKKIDKKSKEEVLAYFSYLWPVGRPPQKSESTVRCVVGLMKTNMEWCFLGNLNKQQKITGSFGDLATRING